MGAPRRSVVAGRDAESLGSVGAPGLAFRAGRALGRWPLPALLVWGGCWLLLTGLCAVGVAGLLAAFVAIGCGVASALAAATPWRRVFVGCGFPLSLLCAGVDVGGGGVGGDGIGPLPAWAWLVPLVALVLLYPRRSWGDAPLFPTPAGALDGLPRHAPLPAGARVLDAGCGLGAGLRELHRVYPRAVLTGLEWSWPLRWLCAWRCRFATVRRADVWTADWSGFDLVYLFQRPESMPRAVAKAERELRPGAWLASLEFEAVGLAPQQIDETVDGKPVWLYRVPFVRCSCSK